MVTIKIKYAKSAVKSIKSIDKTMKLRIKNSIEELIEIPPKGDIKLMQGLDPPVYRLRVGKFRILYEYINIDGEQVLLIKDLGSRGDIYK